MVLAFLAAPLVVAAAVDAPISAVTVYSDRARVTRSVELRVSGTERVELPVLPERADVSTVRVDVQGEGASVERIDVEQVLPEAIPADEARKLLAEIEALDARTSLVEQQLQAWRTQSNTLMQLVPTVPEEALRPAPRLDSSGWAATMSFVSTASPGPRRGPASLNRRSSRCIGIALGWWRRRVCSAVRAGKAAGAWCRRSAATAARSRSR